MEGLINGARFPGGLDVIDLFWMLMSLMRIIKGNTITLGLVF